MSALDFSEMAEWDGEHRPEPSPTRYVLASVTGYSFTQTSKSPSGPKMVATDYEPPKWFLRDAPYWPFL